MQGCCDYDARFWASVVRTLVLEGKLSEADIDESVIRILKMKFELGLFENPYADDEAYKSVMRCEKHAAVNLKAAEEGIVLLTNDGILPLKETYSKIAVIGPSSASQKIGGYSSKPRGYVIKSVYDELGGFPLHTIFNEDMIYAGGVILAGGKVAYCADAKVCHSHNYSGLRQLHRNFDLGVSQAQHREIFGQAGASEGAGIRLVKETAAHLAKSGNARFLPRLVWTSGCKYLGYRLGKGYKRLPMSLIRRLTDNAPYWARMQ
jgi:hypothetical protein